MHIGSWRVHNSDGQPLGVVSVIEDHAGRMVVRHREVGDLKKLTIRVGADGSTITSDSLRELAQQRMLVPVPHW
jgi:hypothetical protein